MQDDVRPDPLQAAANQREAWRARRAALVAHADGADSVDWLAEAVTGLRVALVLNDQPLMAQCLGETAALALGSALARRLEAGRLWLEDLPEGELSMPASPCLPSQWRCAVALALACGDDALLGDLALLATHPVLAPADNDGERFSAALAEALLAHAYDLPGAGQAAAACVSLAATPDEHAAAAALRALAGTAAAPLRLPEDALDAQALAALARERRLPYVAAGAWLPLPAPRYPRLAVETPPLSVPSLREAGWFLEVRALPGERRAVEPRAGESGRLRLRAADGRRWQVTCAVTPGRGAPGLDPGELLMLADRLAGQVDGSPPAEAGARAAQRALLAEAVAVLEALRLRCDPASGRVPEDAFTSEDGRAVRAREPGRFEAERLDAVLRTYRGILAEFDAAAAPPQGGAQAQARGQALAWIELLRAELEPLLRALARDRDGEVARALRPRAGDCAKAFRGLDAAAVAAAWERAWAAAPPPRRPRSDQSELRVHLAPAGMLADDNELSRPFPGGYRWLAPYLEPHRVWARWKFVRPGESAGLAYDGLVWLDDHWAWFPKPYRVLAQLRRRG